jgi:hypothetical protein
MILAIGLCHRALGFTRPYLELGCTLAALEQHAPRMTTHLLDFESSDIATQRNRVVQKAIEIHADALLFVDDDQLVNPEMVRRLLRHRQPVVGGAIMTRSFTRPHLTAYHLRPKPDGSPWFTSIEPTAIDQTNDLIPVDAIGMGLTLLDLSAVATVPAPWFRMTHYAQDAFGEDLFFCQQMKAAGHAVWLDPSVRVPHVIVGAIIPISGGRAKIADPTTAMAEAAQECVTPTPQESHASPATTGSQ